MRPISSSSNRVIPPSGLQPSVVAGGVTEGRTEAKGSSQPAKGAGVGEHWLENLPPWLRAGIAGGSAGVGRGAKDLLARVGIGEYTAPADPTSSRARAEATWSVIEHHFSVPGLSGVFGETPSGIIPATVWPHGQALAAALDLAELSGNYSTVDSLMKSLSAYKINGAYAPGLYATDSSKRLWDDNAWLGLDFMQAYQQTGNQEYLRAAEGLMPFMQEGLHKDGGLYWEERAERMTRNTCANAPAMQLALRLYQATKKPEYLEFAKNLDAFMNTHLRSPEGLYYDNLGDDGKLEKAIYPYNQGAALGADVLMYQSTKEPKYLERAKQTANAALDYYGQDDRLWKTSPAFNAIFFRNLLVLDTIAPDPRYRQTLETYVERIWKEGRDSKTGALDKGGIGSYDPPGLLDQSGFAQMNALLGWSKERLDLVG